MRSLLLFFSLLLCGICQAQFVSLPQGEFANFLQQRYPACFNVAGELDTTCSEIVNEQSLLVSGLNMYDNIEGLRYFKHLQYLTVTGYNSPNSFELPGTLIELTITDAYHLTSLPQLPPGLKRLTFSHNYSLTQFDNLPAGLEYLKCDDLTRLSIIPALPSALRSLWIDFSYSLYALPALPAILDTLSVVDCSLETLPALPTNLTYLNCSGNIMAGFPPFPNTLTYLKMNMKQGFQSTATLASLPPNLTLFECNNVTLTNMPALPAGLTRLSCRETGINALPTLPAGLTELICDFNTILVLPTLPPTLSILNCSRNSITVLPALPMTIRELNCGYNPLQNIPSLPDSLETLHVFYANLQSLPALPQKLKYLFCEGNQLTTLPALPNGLTTILCSSNPLVTLPALPLSIQELRCSNTTLTLLPALPNSLFILSIEWSNIHCLPNLPDSQGLNLTIDAHQLKCLPNKPLSLSLYITDTVQTWITSLPLCNPLNNAYNCTSNPVMKGRVFYDNNRNRIKEAGEPVKANSMISFAPNRYTFTNSIGEYELGANGTGPCTVAVTPPARFNSVPANYQYNFVNFDTLVYNDFALQSNSNVDSLTIHLNHINWAARPGFSYPFQVDFENAGTITSSPVIELDYDENRLDYDSSSNTAVVNNGGRLTLSTGSFAPGQSGSFVAYFRLKTTALIGDSLFTQSSIGNSNITTFSNLTTIIGGSFDPNDKQATPQLTPTQVANGEYIDYTIRFQNTGTDTAFTVIISDTLSSDLLPTTFKMMAASHTCKATVIDNVVFFEFLNILLPDSNINEIKSHGFITFKIKPISTIAVNSNINNKAAIYFDYNAPVITNTAVTAIKNPLVPVPLKLLAFTAARQTANTAILQWNTSNEINTSRFIIQYSTDGSNFITGGTENARSGQYNMYRSEISVPTETVYLRLKMLDVDGRFTFSPVEVLKKLTSKTGFTILNNPAKNILTISVQDAGLKNTLARIINAQGSVVQTALLQQDTEQVSLHRLPAGVYTLHTQLGSEQFVIIQ